MKILITGSSGFIGYHLAKKLMNKVKILGIDNHNKYYSEIIKLRRLKILKKNKNFSFKRVDLTNKKELELTIKNFKPQVVFHLAGQPGVLYSFKNPKSYHTNNTEATKTLCEICLKYNVEKFIFGSSSSVYGKQKKFPIKETSKLNPQNPYAISKLNSEKILKKIFKKKKNYIIFRFFTVYGPHGRPDMFIHKFLNAIKNKKPVKLHNSGLNYRDFTYIDDVVKILIKSINKKLKYRLYNICRSSPILTNELVEIIKSKFKKKKIRLIKTPFVKGEMINNTSSTKL